MKPAVLQHAWLVTWLLAALPLPVDRPGAGISPSVFAPLLHSHPRWSREEPRVAGELAYPPTPGGIKPRQGPPEDALALRWASACRSGPLLGQLT